MREGEFMRMQYAKIFKIQDKSEYIKVDYSPQEDNYYAFLKKQYDIGMKQIVVTSNLMIKILKEYFLKRKFHIPRIEFMIDDFELSEEISYYLKKLTTNREYFALLLEKIHFLVEESSIDIRKIELADGTNGVKLSIQVNGIWAINQERFDEESVFLLDIIKGHFNGE